LLTPGRFKRTRNKPAKINIQKKYLKEIQKALNQHRELLKSAFPHLL
jgi:hypothetical protein